MDSTEFQPPPMVGEPVTMRSLTELLIKHYGLHEGRFDLMVEFNLSTGAMGPDPATPLPGAMFAISRMGLTPAPENSSAGIDAAIVNPRVKAAKKAAAKK